MKSHKHRVLVDDGAIVGREEEEEEEVMVSQFANEEVTNEQTGHVPTQRCTARNSELSAVDNPKIKHGQHR